MSETLQVPEAANYVGGEWRPAGAAHVRERNPARPSDVVGTFPASCEEDVAAAVEAAAALPGLGRHARRRSAGPSC